MPLTDEQRVRYARHLLLPELGEPAQLRLLASRVRFAEGVEDGARDVAGEYLSRAGVCVLVGSEDEHEDAHAHAHVDVNGDALLVEPPTLCSAPALREAAWALSGAFAAVEAIKALTGVGRAARLDLNLLGAEEV